MHTHCVQILSYLHTYMCAFNKRSLSHIQSLKKLVKIQDSMDVWFIISHRVFPLLPLQS